MCWLRWLVWDFCLSLSTLWCKLCLQHKIDFVCHVVTMHIDPQSFAFKHFPARGLGKHKKGCKSAKRLMRRYAHTFIVKRAFETRTDEETNDQILLRAFVDKPRQLHPTKKERKLLMDRLDKWQAAWVCRLTLSNDVDVKVYEKHHINFEGIRQERATRTLKAIPLMVKLLMMRLMLILMLMLRQLQKLLELRIVKPPPEYPVLILQRQLPIVLHVQWIAWHWKMISWQQ